MEGVRLLLSRFSPYVAVSKARRKAIDIVPRLSVYLVYLVV